MQSSKSFHPSLISKVIIYIQDIMNSSNFKNSIFFSITIMIKCQKKHTDFFSLKIPRKQAILLPSH